MVAMIDLLFFRKTLLIKAISIKTEMLLFLILLIQKQVLILGLYCLENMLLFHFITLIIREDNMIQKIYNFQFLLLLIQLFGILLGKISEFQILVSLII